MKIFWIGVILAGIFFAMTFSLATGALLAHYIEVREVVGEHSAEAAPPAAPVSQVGPINTLTNDLDTAVTVAATPTCTSVAPALGRRRAISVQNISTVPVCCSKNSTCTCANPPANTSGLLKAASSATAGDGGSYGLSQYAGAVFCSSSSGSVSVLVGSF